MNGKEGNEPKRETARMEGERQSPNYCTSAVKAALRSLSYSRRVRSASALVISSSFTNTSTNSGVTVTAASFFSLNEVKEIR